MLRRPRNIVRSRRPGSGIRVLSAQSCRCLLNVVRLSHRGCLTSRRRHPRLCWTIHRGTRRNARVARRVSAQDGSTVRSYICRAHYLAFAQLRTRNCRSHAGYVLSRSQRGFWSSRNRACHVAVCIVPVVEVVAVIVIGDVVDVRDARIGHVHVTNVVLADVSSVVSVIPGIERFTPSQREPAAAATNTKAETDAPAASANPAHQGGRVVGPPSNANHRTGSPAPAASPGNPATVMKWCESQRCIVNPGPS